MAQNTQPPSPGSRRGACSMYSLRQPAHSRSSELTLSAGDGAWVVDLGPQSGREVGDGHAALGPLFVPGIHPDRAGRDVVVADDEDVRQLLQLAPCGPGRRAARRRPPRRPGSRSPRSRPATVVGVGLVVVAHRQDAGLDRRQPGREGAGVVLEQDGEEPLDRAEQGPVDHVRPVPLVVGARRTPCRSAAAPGSRPGGWTPASAGRWRRARARRSWARRRHPRPRPRRTGCRPPRGPGAGPRSPRPTRPGRRRTCPAGWPARPRTRSARRRAGSAARRRAGRPAPAASCSGVQKMWASSWVMPRTRSSPLSTPERSKRYTVPNSNSRIGSSR